MKKNKWSFIVISFMAVMAAHAASSKITYQGQLRELGVPVTGSKNMVFSIYASSTGGTAVWTSSTMELSVVSGLFRASLEPTGVDWENDAYVEITVEGITLSPREQLTASPFAINSLELSGKSYTTSATGPLSPTEGDLWFDSANDELKVWSGASWSALSAASSGSIVVEEDNATVDNAVTDIDFLGAQFNVTSSPAGEANISLNTSSVTLEGNSFNSASQLVKLNSSGQLAIANWATIVSVLTATKTVSFGVVAAGNCETDSIGVPGARDGDVVAMGIPNAMATHDNDQVISAYVSSNDVVTLRRCNPCAVIITCPNLTAVSATVRVDVWRH